MLGGWVATFGAMFPNDQDGRALIDQLVAQVNERPAITVLTNAELVGKSGSFGNYTAEVRINEPAKDAFRAVVGSVVIATGFDTYEPEVGEFGYGIPGVLALEFKALVDASTGSLTYNGKPVRAVAYIYHRPTATRPVAMSTARSSAVVPPCTRPCWSTSSTPRCTSTT